jgi:hypothetical protein
MCVRACVCVGQDTFQVPATDSQEGEINLLKAIIKFVDGGFIMCLGVTHISESTTCSPRVTSLRKR